MFGKIEDQKVLAYFWEERDKKMKNQTYNEIWKSERTSCCEVLVI